MSKHYTRGAGSRQFVTYTIALLSFLFLFSVKSEAQVKDSTVTAAFTDFNSYWTSSTTTINSVQPDSSHNLLAFTFRGKTYSTGVDNAILDTKLGSANYSKGIFKALPINNIEGNVTSTGSTYIATASKNDGNPSGFGYNNPYPIIHIADVLTDGKNGLDLGTGVTNLPIGAHISFSIKNLSAKAATDTVPDLLFTQIADPSNNLSDTIFFYDANGKVVGNKKLVNWNAVNKLGTYKLDFYKLSYESCNTSTINGQFTSTPTRDIRMVAFLLTEFGITNTDSAAKVKGVQINPSGVSDQAFIAYNTTLISLDAPVITTQPVTQTFCNSSTTSNTFSVTGSGGGTLTYQWKKNGAAITGATSSSYTVNGLTLADTANAYSVTVTNAGGAVTSDNAYVKYVITSHPANKYIATGATANFTVKASGATGFQWYKNGTAITGATSPAYSISSTPKSSSGSSYYAVVTYAGGTCTSNAATLTVEDLPVINTQPLAQTICNSSTTTTTFSVAASAASALSYQWYKNNTAITGAVSATYSPTGLTLADTLNTYKVTVTSAVGSVTSNSVGFKYTIVTQPTDQYAAPGNAATFTVKASGSTGFQWWNKDGKIPGAIYPFYIIDPVTAGDPFYVYAVVYYAGGTCTTNQATLTVEDLPVINTQPQAQVLCNSSVTTAAFSVGASAASALSYQWYKNNTAITGAVSATYSPTGLTLADTLNTYKVTVTSAVGSVTSSNVGFKYLILSQPAPASAYLATGNTITFTPAVSSIATALQWKKNGADITNANALSYTIDTVTTASAGNYTLNVSYAGGSCLTNASALTTSTVLYSKATGNISNAATWGLETSGLGSTPLNFGRSEHTFVVANRDTAILKKNLNVAGTFDVADGITTLAGGVTLEAGRIIRSLTKGSFAGTATSGLIVHSKSDLYFDAANKVLQTLTINTTDTVTLHTALDMTAGSGHGIVKVAAGVFSTGDSLTLKSDSIGTAGIGNSAGTIIGKATIERYIPAHRAWRLFCAPVSADDAPTIHDAWQEGAISSTDNPHPGFGTHITYGDLSDGFDQNPQHSFSMKTLYYISSTGNTVATAWQGVTPTNTTIVTDYPAYMLFIRGNRSYDITTTNTFVKPLPTIMRTTGNLNQGLQDPTVVSVRSGDVTLIGNPYASPIDFASVFLHSQSIANRFRIWNPNMGGTNGVGAYVTVYWNGSTYKTVPNVPNGANLQFIQANEGFFVEGIANKAGSWVAIQEADKDSANTLIPFGRLGEENESKLEVNLKVFNGDNTTSIADGVAYLFNNEFNSKVDEDDVVKLQNFSENLSIASDSKLLTVEQRVMNNGTDSLHLNLSGVKTTSYQLEVIPNNIGNRLFLFDKYLNTTTPVSSADTSRFTISINADAASKAADRFTIVSKTFALLPVSFTKITAAAKEHAIQVNWSIANEGDTRYYDIQKSTNGSSFSKIGEVNATGSKDYIFTDDKPSKGINYYRVKSVSVSGAIFYTNIANATFGFGDKSLVAVYPNPVTGNRCTIELQNKPAGKYALTLTNSTGQTVFTTTLSVMESNSVQSLLLPKSITAGAYQLQVEGAGKKETIKLIIVY